MDARAGPARPCVALLGLRGSGKSTVGVLLARALVRPFVDHDAETLLAGKRAGWRAGSAGELLSLAGQARFRDLEAAALRRILEPGPRIVLATGGGAVERSDSRTWLVRTARCYYLSVPTDELARRLQADPTPRPSLTGAPLAEELELLLARRDAHYRSLAASVVECGQREPAEIVQELLRLGAV